MILGKIPIDFLDEIKKNRDRIPMELDSVYAKMEDLAEAIRKKEEEERFLGWWDKISLHTPLLTEQAQVVRSKRNSVARCVKALEESDEKTRIAAAAKLSEQIAGILKNILWTVRLSEPEWLALGIAAHHFQDYADGLARLEFTPKLWGEGEYIPISRIKDLPRFDEKGLEENCRYHSEDPTIKKALLRCLIKEANTAYRLSQGSLDPWNAYIVLLDIHGNRPHQMQCDGIEKDVATKALEEFNR